ncbi:tetratricopeptide repeat protein [Kitasatospora sp. NPDC056327]|uniref:tetratricopeptide repeat protein n=1 Tax=Kitasatospora sp. NPDC056327 TaxID=3345785 RepID=UPI0035D545AB
MTPDDAPVPEPTVADMSQPVLELAMALSTATRIEPALLRTMRLTVRPTFDVGVESDLWFGPWAARVGSEYMAFRPAFLAPLRDGLSRALADADRDDPLRQCRTVIETAHRSITPVLGLEEKVTWVAVLAEAGLTDDAGGDIDDLLGDALLAAQQQPGRRPGMLRWLRGAWNRLPRAVRASVTITQLIALLEEHELPAGTRRADSGNVARPWAEGPPTHVLPVRHDGSYITLGDPTWPAVGIRVPDTQPLRLQVSADNTWDDDQEFLKLRKGSLLTVPVSHVPVYLRTTRGTVYRLGGDDGTPHEPDTGPSTDVLMGTPVSLLAEGDATSYGVKPVAALSRQVESSTLPAYVPRAVDGELDAALDPARSGNRLVVAVGTPGSGRTRALWEAVRRSLPDWWLWSPTDQPGSGELATTLSSRPLGTPLVIWLDDLDSWLAARDGERTAAALQLLLTDPHRGPVLVLGTCSRDHPDATGPTARSLLRAATVVTVPSAFTADEVHLATVRAGNHPGVRRARGLDIPEELASALDRGLHGRIAEFFCGTLPVADSSPRVNDTPPLPPALRTFTGREAELTTVLRLLTDTTQYAPGAPTVLGIAGLPGVGKSALALRSAVRLKRLGYFPGGILHAPAGTDRDIRGTLTRFLGDLGLPNHDIPDSTEEQRELYHQVLADRSSRSGPVLVLLDDVVEEDTLIALRPDPTAGATLYTSRQHSLLPDGRLLNLDILPSDQAVALLGTALYEVRRNDTRVAAEPGAAERIAALCGGLPLALLLIAARLSQELDMPLAAMADELSTRRLPALESGDTSIRAVLAVSYRRLTVQQARTLRFLAANPAPDIGADAALHLLEPLYPLSDVPAQLRALVSSGLLDRSVTESGERWSMHTLVRLYAAQVRPSIREQRTALLRLLEHYADRLDLADTRFRSRSAPHDAQRAADTRWVEAERVNLIACATEADRLGFHGFVTRIAAGLAEFLTRSRRFDDLEHVASLAVRAAEETGDPTALSDALNNQAAALYRSGRSEAALVLFRRAAMSYKGNNRHHALVVNNIGAGLLRAGRFDEALAAFEQAATSYAGQPPARPFVRILSNLAHTLLLLYRHDEAIVAYRQAAEAAGHDDAHSDELADVLTSLGGAYRAADRTDEAIATLHRAADLYRDLDDRHGLALALSNLGNAHRHAGRSAEAVAVLTTALSTLQALEDTGNSGQVLTNLASALMETGRFEEATHYLDQAVDVHSRSGDDRQLAQTLNNLGLARFEIGRTDDAVRCLHQARSLHQQSKDRTGEAEVLFNIGNLHTRSRRYREAFGALRTAHSLYREAGDIRGQAQTFNALGVALLEGGRSSEAVRSLNDSLDLYRRLHDSRAIAQTLNNLGNAYSSLGDNGAAILHLQRAARMLTAVGDSPGLAQTLTNLGNAQLLEGQVKQALDSFAQADWVFAELDDRHGRKRIRSYRTLAAHTLEQQTTTKNVRD